jgi:hypothetical protein
MSCCGDGGVGAWRIGVAFRGEDPARHLASLVLAAATPGGARLRRVITSLSGQQPKAKQETGGDVPSPVVQCTLFA